MNSGSRETFQSRFSRFLASKVVSDKYKKDFVVDIALKQPRLIPDFMKFDEVELLNTKKKKGTALSAGKYLIKESRKYGDSEQPILICYMKHLQQKKRKTQ